MPVIRRLECPVHGESFGIPSKSESFYGKQWCQHCRLPASELVYVEYVRADTAQGAIDALREARAAFVLLRERRDFGISRNAVAKIDKALARAGGQSETPPAVDDFQAPEANDGSR